MHCVYFSHMCLYFVTLNSKQPYGFSYVRMPDLMSSVDSAQAMSKWVKMLGVCFFLFALFCNLLSLADIFGREFCCSFHAILTSVLPYSYCSVHFLFFLGGMPPLKETVTIRTWYDELLAAWNDECLCTACLCLSWNGRRELRGRWYR